MLGPITSEDKVDRRGKGPESIGLVVVGPTAVIRILRAVLATFVGIAFFIC